MDLLDSKNVNNRIKKRSMAIACFLHLYLILGTLGIWLIIFPLFCLITSTLLRNDIDEAVASAKNFNKTLPFKYYGQVYTHIQHVFHHPINIEEDVFATIEQELKTKTPISGLQSITITDSDKDLLAPEQRTFLKGEANPTPRGTTLTLILNQSSFGAMRSFEWRVVVGGYVDKNAKFNLIAYSPFTLLFWIVPYLKRETNLLNRVRTVYGSAYNDVDVSTQVRSISETVFDAMVVALDKNGIDTSDLKAQKLQSMNINITGGKVNMGNVVQGAMNKISGAVKGAKA
jgi:hypothetical protein